jgi:tetratricopeptide (TPR) repeat protein
MKHALEVLCFSFLLLLSSTTAVAQALDFCARGEDQFREKNYQAAQAALWECTNDGNATQDQTLHLAWTYRDLHNYSEGLDRVSESLKQRPADENLLYVGAFLHFRRNELEQSVGMLNQAYRLKPDDWRLHQLYALNFIQVGWVSAAEQELTRAIKLNDNMPELYYQLARFYYTMNKYDRVVTVSEKALALAPEYASVYDNLGLTYAGLGDSSRAVENFEKAIKINEEHNLNDEWPLIDYGAFMEDQNLDKARTLLEEAVRMNPANATANYELGRTMEKLDRDSVAESYLRNAIKDDSTYTTAYYLLANLARKRGDRELAAKYLEQFQKLSEQEKKSDSLSSALALRHR